MILPAQAIRKACIGYGLVTPFYERTVLHGMTYGLGPHGYDVRVAEDLRLENGSFVLASTIEHFKMPHDVMAQVCDKSSLARRGVFVLNTVIEAGWRGYLTLEIMYRGWSLMIAAGSPIAQIVFMRLEEATEQPYEGRYQDQEAGPQQARHAKDG